MHRPGLLDVPMPQVALHRVEPEGAGAGQSGLGEAVGAPLAVLQSGPQCLVPRVAATPLLGTDVSQSGCDQRTAQGQPVAPPVGLPVEPMAVKVCR
ncbi:hypothetical protein HGI15_21205 [Modestobacter lapidis]|nr:hypothetical protein [Modestobacter lapidis]